MVKILCQKEHKIPFEVKILIGLDLSKFTV